jgi:hypothetical protein
MQMLAEKGNTAVPSAALPEPKTNVLTRPHSTTEQSYCQEDTIFSFLDRDGPSLELPEGEKLTDSEKRDLCGRAGKQIQSGYDPITGQVEWRGIPYRCNLFRDKFCEPCFNRRVRLYRGRIRHAAEDNRIMVYAAKLSEAVETGLLDEMDKADYLRLPTSEKGEPETGLFFYDASKTDARIGARVFSDRCISQERWEHAVNTRIGKRPSGGLGKLTDDKHDGDKHDDDTVEIEVAQIKHSPSANETDISEALSEANEAISDMEPATVGELERVFHVNAEHAVNAMRARGIKAELEVVRGRIKNFSCSKTRFLTVTKSSDPPDDPPDG